MKTKKGALKRDKILAAAARILKEKGYAEATLNDVAAEAGTYAGSLYYYFPSKDHLVEEVLNLGTNRIAALVVEKVRQLPEEMSRIERLQIALRTHLTLALARDDFAQAYWKVIDQVPHEIRQRHAKAPRAYGRFWKGLIEDAQKSGEVRSDLDARLVSLLLLGSTLYALDWYKEGGRFSVERLADILMAMTLDGIATGAARPGANPASNFVSPEPATSVRAAAPGARRKTAD